MTMTKSPRTKLASKNGDGAKTEKPGMGRRILSFFTGCGGLDLGFEQAGFETVYATDIDQDSCNTLKMNLGRYFNKDMVIEQGDILTIKPKSLPKNIDLVIGGPPCQSFRLQVEGREELRAGLMSEDVSLKPIVILLKMFSLKPLFLKMYVGF